MAWTKMKIAIAVTAGVLLAAGTTTVVVGQVGKRGASEPGTDDSWRSLYTMFSRSAILSALEKTPPQVTILPSIYPKWGAMVYGDKAHRLTGRNSSVTNLLSYAYQARQTHILFSEPTGGGKFDFIANLPKDSATALQKKITEQFGVVAHKAVIPTDVWSLKVSDPEKLNAIISKKNKPNFETKFADGITTAVIEDKTADEIVDWLEGMALQKPVVNRTGLAGRYDLNLSWGVHDPTNRITSVVNQLRRAGLELMLNQEKMEMLVVERVK